MRMQPKAAIWKIGVAIGLAFMADAALLAAEPEPSAAVFGVAINVADLGRSSRFYAMFGLREAMKNEREVALSSSGELEKGAALVLTKSDGQTAPNRSTDFGRVILTVSDARALAKLAAAAGYEATRVIEPKQPSIAAVIVFLKDPDGYPVELYQPTAKQAKK